jgi:tRNA dimethylallyltransferase
MLEAGLVAEVRGLLERGVSPNLPTMSAIGYREIVAHLQGKITLDEAVAQIKRNTRIFVRRQANWFKTGGGQPGSAAIHWLQAGPAILDEAETLIKDWLHSQPLKKDFDYNQADN